MNEVYQHPIQPFQGCTDTWIFGELVLIQVGIISLARFILTYVNTKITHWTKQQ